jgi:hypothetical protein
MRTLSLYILFVSVTAGPVALRAQVNLVPNPSFENTLCCPNGGANWQCTQGWNNVNLIPSGPGTWGTPDFYHPCGNGQTAPPATFSGTCAAQDGGAMFGLGLYNVPYPDYREYLACELTCSLMPGTTYTLSFWITNGTGIKSPWTISNFGANFSAAPLTQSGWSLISLIPQCEITNNIASTSWVQYTFTVQPTSAWKFLTLGVFRSDSNNNPVQSFPNPGGPASVYAYYFIDNVMMLGPTSTGSISVTGAPSQTICSGNSVTLTASGAGTFTWSNLVQGSLNIVTPTVTTVYTVTGGNGGCSGNEASTTVSVASSPALSITGNTLLCKGHPAQSATLTVAGAATYSWNINSTNPSIIVSPASSYTYVVTGSNGGPCPATLSVAVNVVTCTTVDESRGTDDILIYPLPMSTELIVEYGTRDEPAIRIFNTLGQTIEVAFTSSDRRLRFDFTSLPRGLYWLVWRRGDKSFVRKIVKE